MFVRRALGLAILLTAIGTRAEASSLALSFTSETLGFADGASRMLGWQFTVLNNPITVTALGFLDFGQDGLIDAHQVGIWLPDTITPIATATVQAGTLSPLTNFFRFEALSSPVILSANTRYVIAAFDQERDQQVWDVVLPGYDPNYAVSGFTVDSAMQIGAAGSAFGYYASSFGYPIGPIGGSDTRHALMGPNFLIGTDDVAAVPEPASLVLLGSGLVGVVARARRNRKT